MTEANSLCDIEQAPCYLQPLLSLSVNWEPRLEGLKGASVPHDVSMR